MTSTELTPAERKAVVPTAPGTAGPTGATSPRTTTAGPQSGPSGPSGPSGSPSGSAAATWLTPADLAAGLLSAQIPQRGAGTLRIVAGDQAAPGSGPVRTVRVEVERGLAVHADLFADFVLATLNDPRGWGHGGTLRFARTSGADPDIRVVLASPDTSADLCAPLRTMGTLSCGVGDTAVLTLYRWVRATPGYGTDRTGYRQYLVNHEVGHTLGHHHEQCPGPGRPAPVMMQQTKGLGACRPNPWPTP
jgi:hypothetical protein